MAELDHGDDDDDEHEGEHNQQGRGDNDGGDQNSKKQPHVHAMTTILSEATNLLHPLCMWHDSMMDQSHMSCDDDGGGDSGNVQNVLRFVKHAISGLDEESQSLTLTIGDWFSSDRGIKVWLDEVVANKKTLVGKQGAHVLDAILEELAFVCQLLARYCQFMDPYHCVAATGNESNTNGNNFTPTKLWSRLREYAAQFATLEDYLYCTKLSRAMEIATPVEIMDGVYVASLVEDAFYLSKKTLERANSTLNEQALFAMANRIAESWGQQGSDVGNGGGGGGNTNFMGIYDAMLHGKGSDFYSCSMEEQERLFGIAHKDGAAPPSNTIEQTKKQQPENNFASALLDALDDDEETKESNTSSAPSSGNWLSAPASGNSLFGIVKTTTPTSSAPSSSHFAVKNSSFHEKRQRMMDLCAINGIASASSACMTLSSLFQDIIFIRNHDEHADSPNHDSAAATKSSSSSSSSSSILEFTRDELCTYSKMFDQLLTTRTNEMVRTWCGIPEMQNNSNTNDNNGGGFFSSSSTNINSMLPLNRIQHSFTKQSYTLDSDSFHKFESDDYLHQTLLEPLITCPLFQDIRYPNCKVEPQVALGIIQTVSRHIANDILLGMVLGITTASPHENDADRSSKRFTDWGSLLFAKQVRLLQNEMCGVLLVKDQQQQGGGKGSAQNLIPGAGAAASTSAAPFDDGSMVNSTTSVLNMFERVAQAVTILQLEKPSDWAAMQYSVGDDCDKNLTTDEIKVVMSLRVDFSEEAVIKACANLG